jgi:hypothetical protein
MKALVYFLGVLFISILLHADGGMISSGGELLKDAQNPWWVKNTKEVKYCIDIDQTTMSANSTEISMLVTKALKFWKMEFNRPLSIVKNASVLNAYFNYAGVGTQEFIKVGCSGNEDLRLQFGYGTLNVEQKGYIKNISTQIGIAVRTSYDETNLRGRGYIYIGSDLGPNRFQAGPGIAVKPWSNQTLLYLAIVHELGHVFGIPHIGATYTLMSQQFLEYVVNESFAKYFKGIRLEKFEPYPFFFAPAQLLTHCSALVNDEVRSYLSIPANHKCLVLYPDPLSKEILVYSALDAESKFDKVGDVVRLKLNGQAGLGVTIIVNATQRIFPQITNSLSLVMGPGFVRKSGHGIFRDLKGNEKTLHLNLGSQGFELLGLVDDEIKTLISAPILIDSVQNSFGRVKP